jgi:hypothetical protein
MPVVEKIETIGEDGSGYFLSSRGNLADFDHLEWLSSVGVSKINAVYKIVVLFIKWYNKTKKQ